MNMTWPGEQLVMRLWETVAEKGVGSLLKPWQIRREGRAYIDVRREEMLLLAQAQKDEADIRSGRVRLLSDGRLVPQQLEELPSPGPATPPSVPRITTEAIGAAVLSEAIRREVNVASALFHAESELAEDPAAPPDAKIDSDWLFRWRDSAASVTAEELRHLWGRVLAGELKAPGTYSLRTLEFLKNISQGEAKEIERLAVVVVSSLLLQDGDFLKSVGIGPDLGFLLRMQELGVLAGVGGIGLSMTFVTTRAGSYVRLFQSHGRGVLVRHDDQSRQLELAGYKVTSIGQEVLRVASYETDPVVFEHLGRLVCQQGFRADLVSTTPLSEREFRYAIERELCTPQK